MAAPSAARPSGVRGRPTLSADDYRAARAAQLFRADSHARKLSRCYFCDASFDDGEMTFSVMGRLACAPCNLTWGRTIRNFEAEYGRRPEL
jgi:hypothetical protein